MTGEILNLDVLYYNQCLKKCHYTYISPNNEIKIHFNLDLSFVAD